MRLYFLLSLQTSPAMQKDEPPSHVEETRPRPTTHCSQRPRSNTRRHFCVRTRNVINGCRDMMRGEICESRMKKKLFKKTRPWIRPLQNRVSSAGRSDEEDGCLSKASTKVCNNQPVLKHVRTQRRWKCVRAHTYTMQAKILGAAGFPPQATQLCTRCLFVRGKGCFCVCAP